MSNQAIIQIVGTLVACSDGYKDSWRETAQWAAKQLASRFGDSVHVEYFDLFDPQCPAISEGTQLPLILINGETISSGGKISIPVIRKRLEELGVASLPMEERMKNLAQNQ